MADVADVETALRDLIAATLYPNGTSQPSAVGRDCRVYRGWPNAEALNEDLRHGKINISVFPEAGGRNTTRFPLQWLRSTRVPITVTATVSGSVVTIGGTVTAGQLVGIRTSAGAWAYATVQNDTPARIAAALHSLIPGSTVNGAAVTVTPSTGVLARVVGTGTGLKEVRRQCRSIRISFWCPNQTSRDSAVSIVDAVLANTPWLTLADGTGGRLIFRWDVTNDVVTKDALWRRDLRYDVEYLTTLQQTFTEMLFGGGTYTANGVQLPHFGDIHG